MKKAKECTKNTLCFITYFRIIEERKKMSNFGK